MARPEALSGFASGREVPPDQLTPRTPHSKSGRFTEIELDDPRETEDQSAPLLANEPTQHEATNVRGSLLAWVPAIVPILGGILVLMLLVATIISFRAPGVLQRFAGVQLSTTPLPLSPLVYRHSCAKMNAGPMHHSGYWDSANGMGMPQEHNASDPSVCSSTITYMLDGYVGLLADIALLAQVAAFARERNRTLLIDDTYWNRGKWSDYFEDVRATQPGPEPGCKPPPSEELTPCPRTARHWIINSRTAKYHFGHAFETNYEDAYARNLGRSKPMFLAAYASLTQSIQPNRKLMTLIQLAKAELDGGGSGSYAGVHIRRGDRLAKSWQYHKGYVPIANFVQALSGAYADRRINLPLAYVASDSPEALSQFKMEVTKISPKFTVFSISDSKHAELRELASQTAYTQEAFNATTEENRTRETKGMVIDFALLSGSWSDDHHRPGATICTLSSNICKMSAVALGWNRAFGDVTEAGKMGPAHRWIEVDLHGSVAPEWEPLETF